MLSKRYLIIAAPWVGDMVMTHSLVQLLKINDPLATIDVFALPNLHPLIKRMPEVTNILTSHFMGGDIKLWQRFSMGSTIKKNGYDQAYLIPNSFKSALIPFFAKIPRITGYLGEQRQLLINDARILDKEKLRTMVERFSYLGCSKNTALPKLLPLPKLRTLPNELAATMEHLAIAVPAKPILALCPGTEQKSKRWPEKYFAEVALAKKKQGWDIWIFGGKKEELLANTIQKCSGEICLNLCGKTNLAEATDLLSLAKVVVANDSGLMHLASAVHRPVVAIYGPTSPTLAPPLSNNATRSLSLNLSCAPCGKKICPLGHNNCLYQLKPTAVINAIDEIAQIN